MTFQERVTRRARARRWKMYMTDAQVTKPDHTLKNILRLRDTDTLVCNKYTIENVCSIFHGRLIEGPMVRGGGPTCAASVFRARLDVLLPPPQDLLQLRAAAVLLQNSDVARCTSRST